MMVDQVMEFGSFAGDGARLAQALVPDPVPDDFSAAFPDWLIERWDGPVRVGCG